MGRRGRLIVYSGTETVKYHWRELPHVLFLLRQNFCKDKIMFVATNLMSRQIFVATNIILSRQAFFCPNKHVFVATKNFFCRDKSMLVATKPLSRQNIFYGDKCFISTSIL